MSKSEDNETLHEINTNENITLTCKKEPTIDNFYNLEVEDQDNRLFTPDDSNISENASSMTKHQLKYSTSKIILLKESCLDNSKFKDYEKKSQLVKFRLQNEVLYGYITKIYKNKYAALILFSSSLEIIKKHYPNCQFTNNMFDSDKSGVLVNRGYLEDIEGNLIIKANRSIIDEHYIISREPCACGNYTAGEYVKFFDGSKKTIGQFLKCEILNGQHCVKIEMSSFLGTDNPNDEAYVHERCIFKKGLKSLTKFYEGVIVDPSSILKIETCEYESIKVGAKVQVTLRDLNETYDCSVVWLGKVNDVEVAAVVSQIKLIVKGSENLIWNGEFRNVSYCNTDSCIVSLSAARPILTENGSNLTEIKNLIQSIKDSTSMKLMQDDIDRLLGYLNKDLDQLIIFTRIILAKLRTFSKNFKIPTSESADSCPVIDEDDKSLLKCSVQVLDIICNHYCTDVGFIGRTKFVEALQHVASELFPFIHIHDDITKILTNILLIYWNIIKSENIKSVDFLWNMQSVYNTDGVDASIKLIAALNATFQTPDDITADFVAFLKGSYQNPLPGNISERLPKNDILIALGKISMLPYLPKVPPTTSVKLPLSDPKKKSKKFEKESCTVPCAEHGRFKLTTEEYESCIEIFASEDKSEKSVHDIIAYLSKMNNKKVFSIYVSKREELDFKAYETVIRDLDDESMKMFLDKCIVKKSEFGCAVDIAELFLKENKVAHIGTILDKINEPVESVDPKLLSLAYVALKQDNLGLFQSVLQKCHDIDSYMSDGETLLTLIIKEISDEDEVIKAIEVGKFSVSKANLSNEFPIKLTKSRNIIKFLYSKGDHLCAMYPD